MCPDKLFRAISHDFLNYAQRYAEKKSGCSKVVVGCIITTFVNSEEVLIGCGSNRVYGDLCKKKGCLRREKFGEYSRNHRNPQDCRAIHSEIDAICDALRFNIPLGGCNTAYITRYPCEACAKALVAAGIDRVVYGRDQGISDMTKEIFELAGIQVFWQKDWTAPDVFC